MTIIEIIHNNHRVYRAFNSQHGLPMTVIYCADCAGDFHGCYCENVEQCENCEALPMNLLEV
jgi:hypothetical protein